MKSRNSERPYASPKHLDRPKQWVHMPWLLLGMLFVTGVLLASSRLAPEAPPVDAGFPTEQTRQHP